jgi:hypothetical protein
MPAVLEIFLGSPRRLNLRLVCIDTKPVRNLNVLDIFGYLAAPAHRHIELLRDNGR